MYYGCGSSSSLASIRSKADAMKFAIEISRTVEDDNPVIHLDKAKEIFQMFDANINLPDVPNETSDKVLNEVMKFAQQYLGALCKSDAAEQGTENPAPAPEPAEEKNADEQL